MQIVQNLLGVDISADTFALTPYDSVSSEYGKCETFQSDPEGLEKLQAYLETHQMLTSNTVFCLEATGVYAEPLAYFLSAKGYRVAIEAPHKTKRAFYPLGAKTDPLDSKQLAEYAFRFFDQLPFWNPSTVVVEQVRVLLSTREQLVRQLTATRNALQAIVRKVVRTPPAEAAFESILAHLKEQIKQIDQEIKNRTSKHSTFGPTIALITSIPGVGFLLAAHLFALSEGFTNALEARHLASHLGICPLPFQSGTSVRRRSKSRGKGNPVIRKLLYLAAMSLRTHQQQFTQYFFRKTQQGKAKMLVLNNIENRLLKVICAVIRTRTPFVEGYKSVNPMFLKKAA